MYGEFTTFCHRFYKLNQKMLATERIFNELLNNAPMYAGETNVNQIDDIIHNYRNVQAAKAEADKAVADLLKVERQILLVMRHFDIPNGLVLEGEIPDVMQFKIAADENDRIHILKTKTLTPEEDEPNIIRIRLNWGDGESENNYAIRKNY
jgi:hypothetical protein